ncbi:hypothetical protein MIND_00345900 [Mycena indigotica]|uniref:Uncharacterized protein n=1 Tax=Mycena indigotica TaxID=2126181 RepID=A0A8H6T2B4_9AGAR|nr:uncharacterized protein MIND_00345900 [Mycena indigotica]KAF7309741.1 hypothetical protein MIND_00345900 [Mycena indigotica]
MDGVEPTGERAAKGEDVGEEETKKVEAEEVLVDQQTTNTQTTATDNEVQAQDGTNSSDVNSQRRIALPPSPMPNIGDLSLHSPSSAIVGTPFSDLHSARFEYPFPDPSSGPSSSPEISPSSSALTSTSQPQLAINAPPALQHFPASFPSPAELPAYSPTHPRMRTVSPPPEPPSIAKRRQRWTLGLGTLARKLSRSGSAPHPSQAVTPPPEQEGSGHRRVMSDENISKGTTPPQS